MKIIRSTCAVGCVAVTIAVGLCACGRHQKQTATPTPASAAAPSAPGLPSPSSTAVTVDGFAITWGQVVAEMQRLQPASQTPISAQQAADGLVVRHLLSQAADKTALVVTPQEINTAVENVRRQIPTNTTLEAVLRSRNVTEKDFRDSIVATLKVNRLLEQQTQKVTPATDVEIKQFLKDNPTLLNVPETVTVRTILVAVQPTDDAATRKTKKTRAEMIRKQLLNGADFAKLAAGMSDDPSKANGGQLPPLRRGRVPDKTFENAAFTQKVGEIGAVLDTQYGYALVQVQRHVPASTLKLDDVKERVRSLVTEQKRQRMLQDYLNGLRAKANIIYASAK